MQNYTNIWKRNTALFLVSQTLSLLGTMIVQYAIMWYLVLETGSGRMMTLYVLIGVLPTFASSIFGGVLADRYNKKWLINLSDGAVGLVSLLFALFLLDGRDSMALLLVAAGLRALGQGVQQPTVGALIPSIVPEDKLMKVNGMNSSIQASIYIVSPIVAASLMAVVPLWSLFIVDVVTALGAIAILTFAVHVPHDASETGTHYFQDLVGGIRYIRSQRYLVTLIVLYTIFSIALAPAAGLCTLQITRDFGSELWRLSAIEIVWAGGMIVGGFMVGVWSFRNRIRSIGLATVVMGVMVMLLGVWELFGLYLASMGLAGIAQIYASTPTTTMVQERVQSEFLGRVMSVFTMIFTLGIPVGMMIFGPVSDVVSIDWLMVGSGAVIVVTGILYFTSKSLKI